MIYLQGDLSDVFAKTETLVCSSFISTGNVKRLKNASPVLTDTCGQNSGWLQGYICQ